MGRKKGTPAEQEDSEPSLRSAWQGSTRAGVGSRASFRGAPCRRRRPGDTQGVRSLGLAGALHLPSWALPLSEGPLLASFPLWAPGKPAVASTRQGLLPLCPVAMAPAAAVDSMATVTREPDLLSSLSEG